MSLVIGTMVGYNWQCLQQKGQYLSMELIIFVSVNLDWHHLPAFDHLLKKNQLCSISLQDNKDELDDEDGRNDLEAARGVFVLGNAMRARNWYELPPPPSRHLFSYHPPARDIITPKNECNEWVCQRHYDLRKWMNFSPTSKHKDKDLR